TRVEAHPTSPADSMAVAVRPTPKPTELEPTPDVEVRVTASPLSAKIRFDNVELPGNPFTGKFPRDGKTHLLKVTAQGYEPRVRGTMLERAMQSERALVKSAPPPPPPPPSKSKHARAPPPPPPQPVITSTAPPAPSGPDFQEIQRKNKAKPKRGLDE